MSDSLTNSLVLMFAEKQKEGKDPEAAVLQVNSQLQQHRIHVDASSVKTAGLRNIAALHLTHVIKRVYRTSVSADLMVRVLHKAGHTLPHTAFAIERTYGPVTPLTLMDMLWRDDTFASACESDIYTALLEAGFDPEQVSNALNIRNKTKPSGDKKNTSQAAQFC